jgi:hypothetical protein
MRMHLAAAMAMVLISGCATTSSKTVVDTKTLSTLKPGVTTIANVESAYGQPFQDTKEPDGTEKLQYVSKIRVKDDSTANGPLVGTHIPRQIEKNVSAILVFDQKGLFVHAWTSDKTIDENVPGNMGQMQQSDVSRGSMYSKLY